VGYEARLGAEIRVLRLPRGQDPDDLIREEPQRWVKLVEEAVPVVDFHLQMLLEGLDPDDTKIKARVVDKLLPVLRAVANPVEREDYIQKIARALRVDARAVQSRVHSVERQAVRSQRGVAQTQVQPSRQTSEADLESHCLSALLQRPSVLAQVNQALEESQLEPLRGQDFQDVSCRAIFEAWEALLAADHPVPIEAMHAQLPADLQAQFEALLKLDCGELAEEQLLRDIIRTLLRLRERNLRHLGQELNFLTLEAREAGDMRAEQYVDALRTYRERLLRTQQALAQRWGWASRG
jgi:DNA primase